MKSFNEYWKEKSTKRRKSWLAKSKRYAENHEKLETIRKGVYIPLDFKPNTSLDDLKLLHFTVQNPLIRWDNAVFSFSEEGLRSALKAQGADMTTFRMEVSRESIKGKAAPLPENSYGLNKWDGYTKLNRVYDFDRFYFDWLLRIYDICTDMETVRLSYKRISMTIRRYSNEGQPFAYYELNPCEQLCHSAILFQETDFYTLDTATLLMEMAEEWELRQEELNYHAKKLKLRSMDATTTDTIEFTLWDDKKIIKKVIDGLSKMDKNAEIQKDKKGIIYDKETKDTEIVPWKQSIDDYMEKEVLPHVPDAKAFFEGKDEEASFEQDMGEKTIRIGAEIPFTRYFYKYQQPTPSDELLVRFIELDKEVDQKIRELLNQ